MESNFSSTVYGNAKSFLNADKTMVADSDYIGDGISLRSGDGLAVLDEYMIPYPVLINNRILFIYRSNQRRRLVQHQDIVSTKYADGEKPFEDAVWFFGDVTRSEAESLLLSSNGTFLIRYSKSYANGYSLSMKNFNPAKSNAVMHYTILFDGQGFYFYEHPEQRFPSLIALIEAYRGSAVGFCQELSVPCPKPSPEQRASPNCKMNLEIEPGEIEIKNIVTSGIFSDTWLGCWKNKTVAVKTLLPGGDISTQDYLLKAKLVKRFKDKCLVKMYGVCSRSQPIMFVQEFLKNGNLRDYLRSSNGMELNLKDLINISAQVASGLHYLEQRHMIHTEIMAKNIMVSDDNAIKVCDFSLVGLVSDHVDIHSKTGKSGYVKWSAPEVIASKRFSIKSDVWAFGILLMEVFTYGEEPYLGMRSGEVTEALKREYRMPKPAVVPDKIYNVLKRCWEQEPSKRPSFEFLKDFFGDYSKPTLLPPKASKIHASMPNLASDIEMRPAAIQRSNSPCQLNSTNNRRAALPVIEVTNIDEFAPPMRPPKSKKSDFPSNLDMSIRTSPASSADVSENGKPKSTVPSVTGAQSNQLDSLHARFEILEQQVLSANKRHLEAEKAMKAKYDQLQNEVAKLRDQVVGLKHNLHCLSDMVRAKSTMVTQLATRVEQFEQTGSDDYVTMSSISRRHNTN